MGSAVNAGSDTFYVLRMARDRLVAGQGGEGNAGQRFYDAVRAFLDAYVAQIGESRLVEHGEFVWTNTAVGTAQTPARHGFTPLFTGFAQWT